MLRPIAEIAEKMGLDQQALVPYGRYKAKVSAGRRGGRRRQARQAHRGDRVSRQPRRAKARLPPQWG